MLTPKVSVIVVSYNSEDFIEKCLTSLRANEVDSEIIVLDNASTDNTVEKISNFQFQISNFKLIQNEINLGFAKANNLAAKEASGQYLFFLNPDTEVDKPVIDELISFYEENSDCGIVGPKLIMGNGQVQASVRKIPTVLGAFKEYIMGMKNEYSEYTPDGNNPIEVEMVYGAAMLIKKDLFEELGGFDEKYFLYYEDADLCKRIRKTGKKIYYYPKVSVKHLVGGTKSNQDRYNLNLKSAKIYHGLFGGFVLQIIFFIYKVFNKLSR